MLRTLRGIQAARFPRLDKTIPAVGVTIDSDNREATLIFGETLSSDAIDFIVEKTLESLDGSIEPIEQQTLIAAQQTLHELVSSSQLLYDSYKKHWRYYPRY